MAWRLGHHAAVSTVVLLLLCRLITASKVQERYTKALLPGETGNYIFRSADTLEHICFICPKDVIKICGSGAINYECQANAPEKIGDDYPWCRYCGTPVGCDPLPTYKDGSYRCSPFGQWNGTVYQTCGPTCNDGFLLSQGAAVRCGENLVWNDTVVTPVCVVTDQLPQVVIEDGLHSDDLRKDHQVTAPTSGPQDPPNSKNSTKATSTPGDITPPTTGEQENYVVYLSYVGITVVIIAAAAAVIIVVIICHRKENCFKWLLSRTRSTSHNGESPSSAVAILMPDIGTSAHDGNSDRLMQLQDGSEENGDMSNLPAESRSVPEETVPKHVISTNGYGGNSDGTESEDELVDDESSRLVDEDQTIWDQTGRDTPTCEDNVPESQNSDDVSGCQYCADSVKKGCTALTTDTVGDKPGSLSDMLNCSTLSCPSKCKQDHQPADLDPPSFKSDSPDQRWRPLEHDFPPPLTSIQYDSRPEPDGADSIHILPPPKPPISLIKLTREDVDHPVPQSSPTVKPSVKGDQGRPIVNTAGYTSPRVVHGTGNQATPPLSASSEGYAALGACGGDFDNDIDLIGDRDHPPDDEEDWAPVACEESFSSYQHEREAEDFFSQLDVLLVADDRESENWFGVSKWILSAPEYKNIKHLPGQLRVIKNTHTGPPGSSYFLKVIHYYFFSHGIKLGQVLYFFTKKHRNEPVRKLFKTFHPNCKYCERLYKL